MIPFNSGELASWCVNPRLGPLPGSVLGFGDAGSAATEPTEAASQHCPPNGVAGLTKGPLFRRSVSKVGCEKRLIPKEVLQFHPYYCVDLFHFAGWNTLCEVAL